MVGRRALRLLPAVLLPVLVSCTTLQLHVEPPSGFADEPGRLVYRAISPEGILFRVWTVPNDPPKGLDFWGEALRHQLSREGYLMIGQGQRFSGEQDGLMYEWGVRYNHTDCVYLTAVVVFGDTIAVAEAGGEHTAYRRYRDDLIESLKTVRIDR